MIKTQNSNLLVTVQDVVYTIYEKWEPMRPYSYEEASLASDEKLKDQYYKAIQSFDTFEDFYNEVEKSKKQINNMCNRVPDDFSNNKPLKAPLLQGSINHFKHWPELVYTYSESYDYPGKKPKTQSVKGDAVIRMQPREIVIKEVRDKGWSINIMDGNECIKSYFIQEHTTHNGLRDIEDKYPLLLKDTHTKVNIIRY